MYNYFDISGHFRQFPVFGLDHSGSPWQCAEREEAMSIHV